MPSILSAQKLYVQNALQTEAGIFSNLVIFVVTAGQELGVLLKFPMYIAIVTNKQIPHLQSLPNGS